MSEFSLIDKGRGKVILYNGHQYYKKKVYKNGMVWWTCSHKPRTNCTGSITMQEDRIVKEVEHIPECVPDHVANVMIEKIQKCKERVKQINCDPIPTIYNDSVEEMEHSGLDLICKIPPFKNIKSGLYKARNIFLGIDKVVNKNVSDVFTSLTFLLTTLQFHTFLLADYKCDDIRIILFSTNEAKSKMHEVTHYFGDGTFKVCMNTAFSQVYTLHGDVGSTSSHTIIVPLIYVLMSEKTYKAYVVLFIEIIKSQFPNWSPLKYTSDFEEASMKAMSTVFPSINLKGCYFHFGQCLGRKLKSLNLNKNQFYRRCASLCKILALLPENKIHEGWIYIKTEYTNYPEVLPFLNYFENQWMRDSMKHIWCAWGERHCTTNFLEGWHFKLNSGIRRNNNIVHVLNALRKDAALRTVNLKQQTAQTPAENRGKLTKLRERFIRECQTELLSGAISVGHYLEKLRF
ncbi:hypothetical protein ABMA27_010385 [Loxostege sticticalis]|uniref:MULE transposase domain-containing protein n=1 Tax=Loxostege sticticalis TaxID=481309 RepID=A0ABR3H668_LOXSC